MICNPEGSLRDIEYYSIHNGPGIRTTIFLKGCPLRCAWCANADTQNDSIDIAIEKKSCLDGCSKCFEACTGNAIYRDDDNYIAIDRKACTKCGTCSAVCQAGVIKTIGTNTTVKEIVDLVKKDKAFYDASGGGVTISGGEPLAQPSFLIALLEALKEENIHTVLDTSGFAEAEIFQKASEAADMVYFDIKLMPPDKHKKWTDVSNELILSNFRILAKMHKPYHVRFPFIPEITAVTENIKLIAEMINCECEEKELDILPYHRLGVKKYESLGLINCVEQMGIQPPSKEMLMDVKAYFEGEGIKANIIV